MNGSLWQSITLDIVDQAVSQTFQMLIEQDAVPTATKSVSSRDDVAMAVYCDAEQQSVVLIRCSRELAFTLTSRMLETSADALERDDILDATGEVVNVIAGSLRGLLHKPTAMSTPFSVTGEELKSLAVVHERSYLVEQQPLTLYQI